MSQPGGILRRRTAGGDHNSSSSAVNESSSPTSSAKYRRDEETLKATKISASFVMAFGLCFHYFGYECTRACSIALLSNPNCDLGSDALPYTVALGSPFSALVLYVYANAIKKIGAQQTQRFSNIICLVSLLGMLISVNHLHGLGGKVLIIIFYAFREIYVTLVSTQQWSFIAAALDRAGASYLVKFTGFVSVSSAVGGVAVEYFVKTGGVFFLLLIACFCMLMSFLLSELAYVQLASNSVAVPIIVKRRAGAAQDSSIWADAYDLISKYKLIRILLLDAILHQCVSNMLNLMFHDGLRINITNSTDRALVVGRFFAVINVISCVLQIFVIPKLLFTSTLPHIVVLVPSLVLAMVAVSCFYPNLYTALVTFGTLKTVEYSVMTASTEMIYIPTSYEVRYLGKEFVRFFGHKLGRSVSSLALSAVSYRLQPSLQTQLLWCLVTTVLWGIVMLELSHTLKERDSDDDTRSEGSRDVVATNIEKISEVTTAAMRARRYSIGSTAHRSQSDMDSIDADGAEESEGASGEATLTLLRVGSAFVELNTMVHSHENDE